MSALIQITAATAIEPVQPGITYRLGEKSFPVIGMIKTQGAGNRVPLVDIPMMSDFKYQLEALRSRINSPELYKTIDDSVSGTIEQLFNWCVEHLPQATPTEASAFHKLQSNQHSDK